MNTYEKVAESNRIEGISREPTDAEIAEHERFVALEKVSIAELDVFVRIYQPSAKLRHLPGMDVRVGGHTPPKGGEHVLAQLDALLTDLNTPGKIDPWNAHVQYETLHPFSDCNGRSGRILFYWGLAHDLNSGLSKLSSLAELGFLHAFYYQTLKHCATR
jgi:hypothetical protein